MAKNNPLRVSESISNDFKKNSAYGFTKDIRSYLKSSLFNSYYLEKGFYQAFKDSWESESAQYSFFQKRTFEWILDQNRDFFYVNRPSEALTIESYIKPLMLFLGWDQSTLSTSSTLCDSETNYEYDGKIYRPDLVYFKSKNDQEKVQKLKSAIEKKSSKNKAELSSNLKSHVEANHTMILEAKKFGLLKPSSKIVDDAKKDNTNGKTPEQQTVTYMEMLHGKYAILTDGAIWKLFHNDFRHESKSVSFDFSRLCLWLIDKTNKEGFSKGHLNFSKDEAEFNYLIALFYNLFSKEALEGEKVRNLVEHTHTYSDHLEEFIKSRFVMGMNHACNGLVSSLRADGKNPEDFKELIKKTAESHLFNIIFFRSLESRDILPYSNEEDDYHNLSISRVVDYLYEKEFNPSDNFDKQLQLFGDYYHEKVSKKTFVICRNLMRLYTEVHSGINTKLHIKGFKQSIFDKEEWAFAKKYLIPDEYMMNVIFYLNLIPKGERSFGEYQLIPYDFLTPRELGSIFESFLEFELKKAESKMIWNHNTNSWDVNPDNVKEFMNNEVVQAGQYYFYSDNKEKRMLGAVYTPHDIVTSVVRDALSPLVKGKKPEELLQLKILDPAMGSGHFLKGALDFLIEAYINSHYAFQVPLIESQEQIAVNILAKCIYGVDKNKSSVKLAKMSLWLATANKELPLESLGDQLVCGDTLLEYTEHSGLSTLSCKLESVDCVLGNPPYVKANEPGAVPYREKIKERSVFKTLHKKWDLFIPFIELSINIVKAKKGTVGFVVQDSLSYAPFAEKINLLIEKDNHCKNVSIFEGAFSGWAFPAITFIYDYSWIGKTSQKLHIANKLEEFNEVSINKEIFKKPSQKIIQNNKNYKTSISLGSAFYVSKGMVLNVDEEKVGKKIENKIVESFDKKDLVVFAKKSSVSHPMRFADVEDISFLTYSDYPERFVEYGPGLRAPALISRATFPELHSGQRILLSSSKKGRACVICNDNLIVSQNTRVLKKWDDLAGDESRSFGKKIKSIYSELKIDQDEDGAFKKIQAHAAGYSYELVAGILASSFYLKWIGSEKRAKHNVSPDVISEFPLPRLIFTGKSSISQKEVLDYDNYGKLGNKQIVKVIEDLVGKFKMTNLKSPNHKILVICLDRAVESLYKAK